MINSLYHQALFRILFTRKRLVIERLSSVKFPVSAGDFMILWFSFFLFACRAKGTDVNAASH